jgi:diguanylate cyclase (GGDEF)-like protein
MFARLRNWPSAQRQLPDVVFVELIDMLYSSIIPVIVFCVTLVAVAIVIAGIVHDVSLAILGSLAVFPTAGRLFLIVAFRRRLTRSPLTASEARIWERGYSVSSLALAILLGTMCVLFLQSDDGLVAMLTTSLICSYASGLILRSAVRPALCIACLGSSAGPTVVAFAAHVWGHPASGATAAYLTQAILLGGYILASFEMVAHGYRTTLLQLFAKQELAGLAAHDQLTGLANRTLLQKNFSERTRRSGDLLAVHCLDLDRFKTVNDTRGHPAGDLLLQAVSARLVRMLAAGDTVARVGGDEFVVLQIGLHHADEARLLAERLVSVISAPYTFDGQNVDMSLSVGFAIYPADGLELEQLISRADKALYQAKRAGRKRVVKWKGRTAPAA